MAEVISEFVFKRQKRQIQAKYLDGQIWKVEKADITAKTFENFRATLSVQAKRRGLKIRTAIENGHFVVQAFKEQ